MEELVHNELSMDDYPSVLPMPDMPSTQGGSAASGKRGSGGSGAGASARGSRAGQAASARKAGGPTSRWGKSSTRQASASSGPKSFNGGRAIVFMMGGLSYSEMRVARQVMMKESREVVIGSTAFVSPQEFVEDLAALSAGDA
jgi:syntaxin-binding protein 1